MRVQREKDSQKIEEIRPSLPKYVSDYIDSSLDYLTPTSVLSYVLDIQDFLEWLTLGLYSGKKIHDISLDDLNKLIEMDISLYRSLLKNRPDSHQRGERYYKTKNQDSTISRKISALRNLFAFLHKNTNRDTNDTYLKKNIMENAKVRAKKTDVKTKARKLKDNILRNEQLIEFQDFIMVGYGELELSTMQKAYWKINRARDAAIISLMIGSGLRVGELISLRMKDLDMKERKLLTDRKREKEQFIFFPARTREYLAEYLIKRAGQFEGMEGPNDPLFLSKYRSKSNPLSKNAVQKLVMKYADAYGKKMTAHGLRHSFGTYVFNKTKDIRGVQNAMGHSSLETVQIYTHLFDDDEKNLIDSAFED